MTVATLKEYQVWLGTWHLLSVPTLARAIKAASHVQGARVSVAYAW
jgi:hypothetical protein